MLTRAHTTHTHTHNTHTHVDNQIYDEELRVLSGTVAQEVVYGDYFTYTHAPRADIFRRGVPDVVE